MKATPARWLWLPGLCALLLALWPTPARWQLRVLDVGQGLAVLALVGENHEGMIITLDLGGVTLPQGMSLLANLLERVTWPS